MTRIISLAAIVIGIPFMMANPILFFLAVGVALFYLILCKPSCFSSLEDLLFPEKKSEDTKPHSYPAEDFITGEEKIRREMERIPFKKDFKKNPEWQRLARLLQKQVDKAEREEKEILKKAEQDEKDAV